ncbi:MAG TPA: DsrE family protein [Chitinophagaceae bacterium]|nr:DsrE family protein [Chitinophagaceae bacterium]
MKKILLVALLALLMPGLLPAQTTDYKVVFDLTSRDTLDHNSVIRWLNEVTTANPNAQVEVVMYGQGFNMVVKGRSTVADAVERLAANKNVAFKVCAVAMRSNHITPDQLLPGVQVVPDGIYEIISKQRAGWGYIKAVH